MQDSGPSESTITREEFDGLVARVSAGGREDLDELRRTLRANPSIYRPLGDLSQHVQECLVQQVTGQSAVATLCLRLRLDDMKSRLTAKTPLEDVLIEQVLTSWLDVNLQQIRSAQPHDRKGDATHWEQRLDRAQRRHLAAVKALAEVQKLRGDLATK